MIPNFNKTDNPEFNALILKLNKILSKVGYDNLDAKSFSGTTSASANSEHLVKHGMNPRPRKVFVNLGHAYIKSVDNDNIDVRSSNTNEPFEILALR